MWKQLVVGVVVAIGTLGQVSAASIITGGGAGSVSCPDFLNAMQTARQAGGLGMPDGVRATISYVMYVLGFQTGFNWGSNTYDIFGALGADPEHGNRVLFALEPYCANHPEKHFDDALFDLVKKLQG